jgi:hypothetical protein
MMGAPIKKLTAAQQRNSLERLAHPADLTAKLERLRKEMLPRKIERDALGSREPLPAEHLADMYYTQTAEVARRRAALLNKYLPAEAKRKLTPAEMQAAREYAMKQVEARENAVKRAAMEMMLDERSCWSAGNKSRGKQRFDSKEEELSAVHRLTAGTEKDRRELLRALELKYLRAPDAAGQS